MSVDHVERGLKRLPEQFKNSPNVQGLLTIFLDELAEVDSALDEVVRQRSIKYAQGEQLTQIGDILAAPRKGVTDDEQYRTELRLQAGINNSEGTPENILDVWRGMTQSERVSLTEVFPAGILLYAETSVATPADMARIQAMVGAGIALQLSVPGGIPFTFAGGEGAGFGSVYDTALGGVFQSTSFGTVDTPAVTYHGSAKFGSTGINYLTAYTTTDLDLSTEDFTIEMWAQRSVPAIDFPMQLFSLVPTVPDTPALYLDWQDFSVTTLSEDWIHIAVVRSAGDVVLYRDGVHVGSPLITYAGQVKGVVTLGTTDPDKQFIGHIDDCRITKGVARYTADFTPPASLTSVVDSNPLDNVLLLHFDGENGATIFVDSSPIAITVNRIGDVVTDTSNALP